MSLPLRIGTFNCENLFQRSKLLNLKDEELSRIYLGKTAELQTLLDAKLYDDSVRQQVFEISSQLVKFIDFRIDFGSLGAWKKRKEDGITGYSIFKNCLGRDSWSGQMLFRPDFFTDTQRKNTAQVILDANVDVLCLVEIENMTTINAFNSQALQHKYSQYISIDSPNDPRGIDVACLSKFPILQIKTHVFDDFSTYHPIFSRDCLEVKLDLGTYGHLTVLCNHFKSQRAFSAADADASAAKRKAQAQRVVEIINNYDLETEMIAVMGDLNEDSSNPYNSLKPLFDCDNLYPVVDPSLSIDQRYSHYYAGGTHGNKLSQLDYIFISKPLFAAKNRYGFVREGIFGINTATSELGAPAINLYSTVTSEDTSASDHAAFWVEFNL
ncbi:endonuclease/exonuclease/phosphatase family protein [Azotosporobacter soli]|uniref:endonuclease/exonuclease/phosphatase family protein n=1 Tax=Azotosporobacter soli TaxID=3055040 RepID=UPI0031FE9EF3